MKIVLDRRYLEMIAPLSKFIQNHLEGLWLVDQQQALYLCYIFF